jgi:hypothetical protein
MSLGIDRLGATTSRTRSSRRSCALTSHIQPWLSAYLRVAYRAGMNDQPLARASFDLAGTNAGFAEGLRGLRRDRITAGRHRLKVRPGRALE